MRNAPLHITCTSTNGATSTAELTLIDIDSMVVDGCFKPAILNGLDVMFWFGEFLQGNRTDLTFKSKYKPDTNMIPLDSIKTAIQSLSQCDENEYRTFINTPSVKMFSQLAFVDCHEYGEAYYLGGKLIAYHEIFCMGSDAHYIIES